MAADGTEQWVAAQRDANGEHLEGEVSIAKAVRQQAAVESWQEKFLSG